MSNKIIAIIIVVLVVGMGYWLYQYLSPTPLSEDKTEETGVSKIETTDGGAFSVVLEANPTTGYQWEIDFNSNYIQLIARDYTPSAPELIGSGGEETFNFLALKSGETEIKFSYLRPWEEDIPPIEEKVYEIIIR